ncbi:hypothetical protein LEP1GSC082_2978 [Leptospira kirschneri str. H2]|uniref:Uncharacterized protein n=1 Tax=Leptospira kirschneri str. H1 TaxID=1049966 RepID=A0A0E2B094_9LEPT|nr:hypothetical protein LEP1GSC081_1475 [Leptospira kirschneri str. H1]EKO61256.1 hypothetical protein LEP1GSC082_2978 [Leptospira kirschneri str. H2]
MDSLYRTHVTLFCKSSHMEILCEFLKTKPDFQILMKQN